MSKLLVDSQTLIATRNNLGRLHDQLAAVRTILSGYEGELGGQVLDSALAGYSQHWHHDFETIGGDIAGMMSRLTEAAGAYERIEKRLGQAGQGGGMPTGPGTGSGTTTIGGPGGQSGKGQGTTVVGGRGPGGHGGTGHGTTVVDPGRHHGTNAGGGISVSSPLLTGGQEQFIGKLAMLTGLNPRVVAAWTLAEESGGAAADREAQANNNWLNIDYLDSGPGTLAFNSAFHDPDTAAEQTARFLEGKWGGASSSIRSIVSTAGESPDAQMRAIADSDWASSHYGGGADLHGTYNELSGLKIDHRG